LNDRARRACRARRARRRLALWLALAAPCGALGQVIPGSGELLQQTTRPTLPKPSSDTGLKIDEPRDEQLPTSAPFLVRHIEISGNTLLKSAELRSLIQSSEGKMLNLSYLQDLAAVITKRYQDHGYLLSRAYVPPQILSEGKVRIAVLEALYGAVTVLNSSPVSDAFLKSYLRPLQPGSPVIEHALERSLLLLSDVPGTVVSSTLAPGADPGTTVLQLTATPGARASGSFGLDNAGNRYTGRERLSAAVNVDDPLHRGDVLSLNAMTSGPDLSYGRVGYQALLEDGEGTTVGGALSGLYYRLGHGLSDLHAHGTAAVETLTVMQPLIRSIAGNLFAQFAFDAKQLRDETDASDIHTDRHTDALTATLAGDHRDSHGISNMSLGLSFGRLGFDNEAAALANASTARTAGTYAKFTLSLARLQALSESNSLYVAVNGQAADKNLDSSEQFFLGGPNSVRAYDVGTLGGAEGALATAELRHNLGVSSHGTWQTIFFADRGYVRIYKDVFDTSDNAATLSGVGIGLNWAGGNGWTSALGVARPVGAVPALVGETASWRVWLEFHKAFYGGFASHH
jgi:hemolysin activation/secretion protein